LCIRKTGKPLAIGLKDKSMSTIRTLTDTNWEREIGEKPAMLLISTGENMRGDFSTEFKKSAAQYKNIVFAQIDPTSNPQLAERFQVKDKPVLVSFLCGDTLVRRVRPWGTDVVLALELLVNKFEEQSSNMSNNIEQEQPVAETVVASDKPVTVTDNDFQEQVIDYSNEMPVLVDFWAEWCGPCRMVAPIMEKLATEFAGQIRIAKVDTDANQGLSQAFRIMSIPTIMAFKDGKLVFSQPGAYPEPVFRDLIQQLIALDVQAAMAEQEARQSGSADDDMDEEETE
jgi:thioredoxin 1